MSLGLTQNAVIRLIRREADCSRKAKESRKKELQQQKALEASQPRKKAKRNQERDGEVLVEGGGATEEGQRPAEGRPKVSLDHLTPQHESPSC